MIGLVHCVVLWHVDVSRYNFLSNNKNNNNKIVVTANTVAAHSVCRYISFNISIDSYFIKCITSTNQPIDTPVHASHFISYCSFVKCSRAQKVNRYRTSQTASKFRKNEKILLFLLLFCIQVQEKKKKKKKKEQMENKETEKLLYIWFVILCCVFIFFCCFP